MSYPRFEIKTSASNTQPYYFNLKAVNAEIILTSETYTTKQSAETGIASVKQNAPISSRFEKKTSVKGEPYFVLKAANGQIIGTSEMYSSEAARDNGILAVQRDAPVATVLDVS